MNITFQSAAQDGERNGKATAIYTVRNIQNGVCAFASSHGRRLGRNHNLSINADRNDLRHIHFETEANYNFY